jgi:hypothetical protein
MNAEDLETTIRMYLNEATAKFYTQAEIWNWISAGSRDISRRALCVRRILEVQTDHNVRSIPTNSLKVMYVEYVGTRPKMLTKIDPLKIGHYPLNGTAPQYWYDLGDTIEIEPLPDDIYNLKLYVAGNAKLTSNVDFTGGSQMQPSTTTTTTTKKRIWNR